eukprot:Seg4105.1 transcript_id=Seg4105.1/GoldUCD/mRNA.D3Y31 product="hypothetical protein" protein_id=Seg4105.1/GoldUCD/D3Y31
MAPFWLDTTIFQTASQLSKSVADLNQLLSKEREKCHRLMLENIDLQSKLRHDGNLLDRSHDTSDNQADNRNGPSIVSCEQVNNSVDSVNPEVQIEINNNEEASTSTASAPNVSVSDVSGIVNAAEASQVPEVATISSVRKRCDQNVNKVAVEDAASTITPDSVTPSSSSNALNEQLPSGNDTGDVKHRYKTQNPSQSRSKRTAVIMGDSLVKI